jgi:hypothetical protein
MIIGPVLFKGLVNLSQGNGVDHGGQTGFFLLGGLDNPVTGKMPDNGPGQVVLFRVDASLTALSSIFTGLF